jgi:hypothetical protein
VGNGVTITIVAESKANEIVDMEESRADERANDLGFEGGIVDAPTGIWEKGVKSVRQNCKEGHGQGEGWQGNHSNGLLIWQHCG